MEGSYRLASPHSFTELLKHNLGLVINIQMNAKPINSALLTKLDRLQDALKAEVRISLQIHFIKNQNLTEFSMGCLRTFPQRG